MSNDCISKAQDVTKHHFRLVKMHYLSLGMFKTYHNLQLTWRLSVVVLAMKAKVD